MHKNIRIKILKDTPFHKKDTKLTIEDFRAVYNWICVNSVSDEDLVKYIKDYTSHPQLKVAEGNISDWFGVIEEYDYVYRVGDWVWHEQLKRAFCVVIHNAENLYGKDFKPNYVTFEAANQNAGTTYKRKATQEEIDMFDLRFFCDKRILVGQTKCYYYSNTWKELKGVRANVEIYMAALKSIMSPIYVSKITPPITYDCKLNGIKVGCLSISHEEILEIAIELGLM